MKLIFLAIFMFATNISVAQTHNVTTFTDVPKNMEGCGENLFLNKQDEKAGRFIFYTDYVRGLICINNKIISISRANKAYGKDSNMFSNKDYILVIKYGLQKTTGDESYEIRSAIITLKYHSKVVWTKSVIGGGGC